MVQGRWTFPADPSGVPEARHAVTAFVDAHDGATPVLEAVRIAVTEAVTNAVLHGYRGAARGTVSVQAAIDEDDTVTISVRDEGQGMSPDPDSPGLGVGLSVIETLATRSAVRVPPTGRGTEVEMVFAATG